MNNVAARAYSEGAAGQNGQNSLGGEVVLEAKGLTKRFTEGRLDVTVLHGVDLQIRAGETLAIVGASGSGKSTLLHLLGGLDAPTAGTVRLKGEEMSSLSAERQGQLRNQHLGFIYQFHHLLPEFSALDNVAMPLRIRRLPLAQCHAEAERVLPPWAWPGACSTARPNSRAASASAWPLPAPWSPARPACWPTSPPATSTAAPPMACST